MKNKKIENNKIVLVDEEKNKEEKINFEKEKLGFKFTRKHQIIVLSILSIFLFLFIIIKIVNVIQKEYESPIKEYYNGLEQMNIDTMLSAYPEEIRKSKKNITKEKVEFLKKISDGSFTIGYNITKEQELDELKLKEIVNELEKEYDKSYDVKKGYIVTVESTLKYKETESITTKKMNVIQIGWNWYILE